ncbi:MAG: hypothetical protein RL033_1641 [Pseudomonadota bacterium]
MFLVVQQIMRRIARSSVHSWLLLATVVGLFGCPLLLDDDFSIGSLSTPDAGEVCIGATCHVPYSSTGGSAGDGGDGGETGGSGGVAGTSGGSAGAGGSSSGAGSSGVSGASGSAGAGNSGGSAGAGSAGTGSAGTGSAGAGSAGAGSAGEGGGELACRTLELTGGTHDSSSNCLGIAGSNIIQKDTETTLTLSYEDGDPCFSGTVGASPDWGATYEFSFATGTSTWNADTAGVTGFEFAYRGSAQPPSVRVLYKDPSGTDNCRVITPGTTSVPFTAAHPSCSTNAANPVVDSTRMDELILAILPQSQSYAVDFCVQIRALD